MLEGRARLTAGFIRFARGYQAPAGTEPKLALAIAAYARSHPVAVTTTTSQVIDLGTGPPAGELTPPTSPSLVQAHQPSREKAAPRAIAASAAAV